MRKFKPLCKPDKSWESLIVFLGYDPVERKHKVVSMTCDQASDECRVLTLGSDQESWRTVKTNYKHLPFRGKRKDNYGPCRCINGVLYYQAEIGPHLVIMSFDVKSEKFHAIRLPWDDEFSPKMMISYKGKLAYLGHSDGKNSLLMWVLEDAKKGEWSTYNFLPLSHYDRSSETHFKLIAVETNFRFRLLIPTSTFTLLLLLPPTAAVASFLSPIPISLQPVAFTRFSRGLEGAIFRSGLPDHRPEKEERYYTTRGVVDSIGKVCLDENNNGEDGNNKEESMWPKLFTTLSNKEKEEDFMAMKGCKPSHRPKKSAKLIQRSLLLVSPGTWLADLCLDRYDVRVKKSSKKRRARGLKAMGNMETDSD
ncbi:unnamed protein product [Arabidopsis arenosa]|uniref:F-box associated beta-propeller type 3 domain-containing protein n=1 Tax=Arabidopsis arenosa TaxID=38785 RepID=A0A8S1ZSJ9_ARAAE|nr:unnamed protein product [Arabidopsis arenosa]